MASQQPKSHLKLKLLFLLLVFAAGYCLGVYRNEVKLLDGCAVTAKKERISPLPESNFGQTADDKEIAAGRNCQEEMRMLHFPVRRRNPQRELEEDSNRL